jgi:predicted NAD-dependent protein-ADP-ribosyltransferase YbiA (DUF1768 family)
VDIGSGKGYPSSALSNFAPHPFTIDGVECNSMEGFLQSLKFKNPDMQREVCKLVGKKAKFKGKKKKWWRTQTLWWMGKELDRHGKEYQDLLDRAFSELAQNNKFKKALLATGDAVLKHSIGKSDASKTILTRSEFCKRLTWLRDWLKSINE